MSFLFVLFSNVELQIKTATFIGDRTQMYDIGGRRRGGGRRGGGRRRRRRRHGGFQPRFGKLFLFGSDRTATTTTARQFVIRRIRQSPMVKKSTFNPIGGVGGWSGR
jgi:hypothetical protein